MNQHNRFPTTDPSLTSALNAAPVMLDGMTVLFDERVGLYPVDVEITNATDQDASGSDGRREPGDR